MSDDPDAVSALNVRARARWPWVRRPRWIPFVRGETAVEFGEMYLCAGAEGLVIDGIFAGQGIPANAAWILLFWDAVPRPPR